MSMSFALNVPTDIPWRRICVSEDMLDRRACDKVLPPRWKSSIVIYRYDPADEYQPYDDLRISYLKVAVTITPWAPELGVDLSVGYVPPQLVDSLQEAFPVYGALLHVSVTPKGSLGQNFAGYPYIADCEPKKRELYEMVTDTGEVLSGSSSSLSVGKAATTTNTTENYNIDTGWNFGMQGSYAGTGGGFNAADTGQTGSVNSSGLENTNIHSSETSTERRELQSHVTQLAQMYNLFQAFHIGTNRGLFFLEPRPHIRQAEASFINGPRALEGLQEVFLTIVHPKDRDYCVGTVLECAHLTKEPVYVWDKDEQLFTDFRLHAAAENRDTDWSASDVTSQPVSLTRDYTAPPGYEITGYSVSVLNSNRVWSGPTVTHNATQLSVSGSVTWRFWEGNWSVHGGYEDNYDNGTLNVDVRVYLRKREPRITHYLRKLFIAARQLCCCEKYFTIDPTVVYEATLTGIGRVPIGGGIVSDTNLAESRRVAAAIRDEMISSVTSSRRVEIGSRPYERSDAFLTRVADVLLSSRSARELSRPLEQSTVIGEENKEALRSVLGPNVSLADVLTADAVVLGRSFGVTPDQALEFKQGVLSTVGKRLGEARKRTGFGGKQRDRPPK